MTFDEIQNVLAERFPASDIEQPFDLAPAIYEAYARGDIGPLTIRLRGTSESPRRYLGASGLAEECTRKAWARYRGLSSFPGRIKRLFRTGDVYEVRMQAELRTIGFEVEGDQSRFEAMGGRVAGHTDGFARLADVDGFPWLLTEQKTANHKRTTALKKLLREEQSASEALRKWKATYHGQIHLYMVAFDVPACLYLVTDKDKDEIVSFLVERDDEVAAQLRDVAREILDAQDAPPARAYDRAKTPDCTMFCGQLEWCWYGAAMPRACGSCRHWRDGLCSLDGKPAVEICNDFEQVDADAVADESDDPWLNMEF